MTLNQACEYLSISEATGYNWIRQGILTPDGYGEKNKCLFRPESIKTIKENLQLNGKLTKRRNKTALRLPRAYADYLDCAEDTVKQLNDIVALCQEKELSLIDTIAYYAKSFFQSAGTLQTYAPLVDDLLALAPTQKETAEYEYPPLTFLPYEDLLGYLYISLTQLDKRKKSGIYYTPSRLVKKLIDRAAGFTGNIDHYFDPACGTGNFLLQMLSYNEKKKDNSKIWLIGQDIDSAAVAIARINVALNSSNVRIDELRENIRVADSLLQFPICKNTLIFGNPPWGAELSSRNHDCVKDSAALFVQNSIQRQSDNGVISFLLPASLLTAGKHREMRKVILENTQMISVDYMMQSFTSVDCPSVILTMRKDNRQPGVRCCDVYKETKHYTIHNRSIPHPSSENVFSVNYFPMLHADDASYALFCRLDSMEHTVRLKGAADFAIGIVTGDNNRFLIRSDEASSEYSQKFEVPDAASLSGAEHTLIPTELIPYSDPRAAYRDTEHTHIPAEPIIRGANLSKYRLKGPFDRIRYVPEVFQQCAKEEFYRAEEKLLYRFIGNTPVFSYDNHGYLTLNSCNILIPRIKGLDIKYILAVLNSDIAAFYWRIGFHSVKLLKSHIEALPIPIASDAQQERIISLVDKILTDAQNYDIITAKEKQATRSGICFSAVINEQTFDEVKQGARKRGFASFNDPITVEEKQATRSGICFSAVINEQTFDEVKQEARKRGFASFNDPITVDENQATQNGHDIMNAIEEEISQLYGLTDTERSLIRNQ